MRKLMRQLGFDESEILRLDIDLLNQADLEQLIQREPEPVWTPNWLNYELDFDVRPVEDEEKINYLKQRQVYDLAVWLETDSEYAGLNKRVILPMTYENRLVGFQSRYVGTIPEKYSKYYKKVPSDYVFGLDNQKNNRQFVIVSEGEFDALLTSGLSLGSNNLSDHQAQLIEDLNIEPIVIPDKDKSGLQLVERAADYGWSVSFPEWENCKDVSDAVMKYGRLFAIHSILQAAEHSPTKIRLMGRRYCR
jgi:DNA primase